MRRDDLGDRMKGYEEASTTTLPRRLPVILRVDGKSFHTYTRGLKPFDPSVGDLMIATAKALCQQIQGAQLAYTQSDEISLLLHGYKNLDSDSWFDNKVQKMASVSAGITSAEFTSASWKIREGHVLPTSLGRLEECAPAVFDARVFVLPESDVCNYFIWRQRDAIRNSVQMLAHSLFSSKQCHGKNNVELRAMCSKKGHDWAEMESRWRRGACIRRIVTIKTGKKKAQPVERHPWETDLHIPDFALDRGYIEGFLATES
jgi:tRNA(His) guanylyltransferase